MILGNRALFVLLTVLSAVLAGCGGGGSGGGGGGGGTPATSTPTSTPTGGTVTPTPTAVSVTPTPIPTISPSPVPTALPSGAANTVTSRPLTAGDTFSYAGTMSSSFVYYGTTTTQQSGGTVAYNVAQSVVDVGPTPFGGANPYDLQTSETDTGTNQTITSTTNTFLAEQGYTASQNGLFTYGYTSSDSNGQQITDALAGVPNNGLLDILPETGGQEWTNSPAQTFNESEADGFTANRTTAGDGSYSETDTYPQTSAFSSPAPLTATITANSDGSGTYVIPEIGNITVSAPSGGTINVELPDPNTGSGEYTFTVPIWYNMPLYSEVDRDNGAVAIPSACNVPSTYGTQANAIEQSFTQADPVEGTDEDFDQTTYVVGGYPVCTTLTDVTRIFYDYSGQSNEPPDGVDVSGGSAPVEVDTVTSTLGLTATNEAAAARTRDARTAAVSRSAAARTNFLATIERRRLQRRYRIYRHLRSGHFMRTHR